MMPSTIEKNRPAAPAPVSFEERSDEELLLAYRARAERGAFEALVQRYETELYSYLRNYLGDAQMAEDAFQATFLQVHLKCERFEPGRKVRPWLYAVATNQAIDSQRRNRRHRMVSLDRCYGGSGADDEEGGSLMSFLDGEEPSPAEQFALAEEGGRVREAVDRLAEPLRRAVILVYYQGLKYREAAEALGVPVGTIKSRLHAAIGKLNQRLTPAQLLAHE